MRLASADPSGPWLELTEEPMVITTNRGWRSWRRDGRHPFAGHTLTGEDVAELSDESISAPSRAEESRGQASDPLVFIKLGHHSNADRRES
jgi:hypothetical protein